MEKQKPKGRKSVFVCAIFFMVIAIIFNAVAIKRFFTSTVDSDTKVSTKTNQITDLNEKTNNDFTVCIDAGHGGEEDPGALSNDETRYESNDNLAVALKVQEYLEQSGVTVIMTRTDNMFVELYDRADIANTANVDLFVSLHRNSAEEGNGVEIWVNYQMNEDDITLATNILDGLDEVGVSANRGVQYGYQGYDVSAKINYAVNDATEMPSCLVELGFITNDTDNKLFDENLDSYAKSIADGIIKSANSIKT